MNAQLVQTEAQQPLAIPNPIRSLMVTIGPSLALDGLLAVCTWKTITGITGGSGVGTVAALGTVAPWLYLVGLRRWVLNWGATPAEIGDDLPGDDIVPQPQWQSTRAIDIAAPVEAVWPWLAQMGQDRGGLYSYDWLENVAGLDFHSADHIVTEWQDPKVGDVVRFAPNQDTLLVARAEPNNCLVWRVLNPATHQVADPAHGPVGVDASWAFVLRKVDARHTRLIQRFRFRIRPRALAIVYIALVEIPHFIMERRMLLGIRERAERLTAQAGSGPQSAPTLLTWFFRLPVALYRLGLAEQLGRSTLLLTTRGRKTGRQRTTALNYVTEGDVAYVLSGMGTRSDWLRNLQVDPNVQVQIGTRRFQARAAIVVDPVEQRRLLCLWVEQSERSAPPAAVRTLLRRLGFDYDASIRRHLEESPQPPLVALRPCTRS